MKNLFSKNLPAFAKTLPATDLFSNKLFARWLPVMRQTPVHRMAMVAAGLAVTATAVGGPAVAFDGGPAEFTAPRPWGRDEPSWLAKG